MKLKSISMLLFLFSLVLSGCSDPKEANKENFKQAAQIYLDQTYPKCYFYMNFPYTLPKYDFSNKKSVIAAMTDLGFIKKDGSSYILTDEGKKHYTENETTSLGGDPLGGFCGGKATVIEIDNFSEPANMFGRTISEVKYTYQVSDLPDWMKSPEVTKLDRTLKTDLASETKAAKGKDVFLLSGEGWIHEKIFKE